MAGSENEVNLLIPGNKSTGGQIQLFHNLSVTSEDYLMIEQGLHMLGDDNNLADRWPDMKKQVKWTITGKRANQDTDINTMLPDDVASTCYGFGGCTYSINEVIYNDGILAGGISIGYDWQWYRDYGLSFDLEEAKKWEEAQCAVHNDCYVYENRELSEDGVGEICIEVTYVDGPTITGLYCEVYP